jgi:hypothetical protein
MKPPPLITLPYTGDLIRPDKVIAICALDAVDSTFEHRSIPDRVTVHLEGGQFFVISCRDKLGTPAEVRDEVARLVADALSPGAGTASR